MKEHLINLIMKDGEKYRFFYSAQSESDALIQITESIEKWNGGKWFSALEIYFWPQKGHTPAGTIQW